MTEFVLDQNERTVDFTVSGCNGFAVFDAGDVTVQRDGKLLCVDVTLKSVCPNKRVALGVLLSEMDAAGSEERRGMRTLTVPAQTSDRATDIAVRGIRFVLPADISLSDGNTRRLRLRFLCNYIESDVSCVSFSV